MTTAVALPDLTSPQLVNILSKLQIEIPAEYDYDEEQKLQLLHCSKVFRKHLSVYEDVDIFAVFDKTRFIDFTVPDEVKGIFPTAANGKKKQYPCIVCADEVTAASDKTGYGLECSGCGHYFHNNCNEKPISNELFIAIKTSPEYVKVYCPECNYYAANVNYNVKLLRSQVTKLTAKVAEISEDMKKPTQRSYMAAVGPPQKAAIQIVKALAGKNTPTNVEKEAKIQRDACTLIVKKPLSRDIRNSEDIRKSVGAAYGDVVMRHARTTPGGSIRIEFQNKEDADKVAGDWKDTLFGGNSGVLRPGKTIYPGIIRNVYKSTTAEEVETGVKAVYPNAECDIFKREGKFSGTVKVLFKSEEDLKAAMATPIGIASTRYVVDEYEIRSRVIKCNNCQKFAHIARLCRSKTKCGKCAKDHDTRACTITDAKKFKCAHCNGNHRAGDKGCEVVQAQEADLQLRSQYGY